MALEAGKSIRRVADVLGHSDPALTLRVYAHAIHEADTDLSFADFGGPGRPFCEAAPLVKPCVVDPRSSAVLLAA
jgi:hypothetical protein